MISMRCLGTLVPAVFLGLLCQAAPAALQDADTALAEQLGSRLAAASALIESGDLQAGRQAVLDLVNEHAGSQELLLKIHRVKELLKRCSFRETHEVPAAEDLIAGDLQSYDRRSGKISVRYRRAETDDDEPDEKAKDEQSAALDELVELLGLRSSVGADDFTWAFGVPMHPIVFDGPYTVEIEGVMPKGDDIMSLFFSMPEMVVSAGEEGIYRIYFGYPRIKVGINRPSSVVHYAGGRPELLDEDDGTPLELGERYSVKINVSKSTITASANGRTFLKAKKQGDSYGQFGFRGCPGVTQLTINGQANTAWVEGLEDRWLYDSWESFDEHYDPLTELPAELAETIGEAKEYDRSMFGEIPGGTKQAQEEHNERLKTMERRGQLTKLLNYVKALDPQAVGAGYCDWLTVQCQAQLGQREKALALCDELTRRYADFVPVRLLKADMLAAAEDEEGSRAVLRQAIEETDDPRPHVQLVAQHVVNGRYDEARRAMVAALDDGVPAAELEGVAFMLTRASKGPEWPETFAFKSRNYEIRSNLNDKVCAEASKTLEASLAMYSGIFGSAPRRGADEGLFQVYLFSGQSSYLSYAGDLFGYQPFNTAGLYSPVLQQLLIWNLPDHDQMLATVRHEGFHQYLDRLVGETPAWFNEGTAEYLETARLVRGKMTPGAPLMNSVYHLADKDTKWADMGELVRMSRSEFYGDSGLHYPQSWALIHYLLHSDRDNARRYDTYFKALVDGASRDEAADIAFKGLDMETLRRNVKAHIQKLAGNDE